MRILLFLVSVIPSLVFAAAAEDFHYYAVFANNKVVVIEFSSDGMKWNDNRPIYSNKKTMSFAYCWGSEDFEHFYCSEARSKLHTVAYRKGPESGGTHRAAMKLFKRNVKLSETGGLQEYYVCENGCSSSMPRFIFNVGDSGC
jgi:hypothetical protein